MRDPAVATTAAEQQKARQPLVTLEHVDKHFGELHVLDDVTTSVQRGEVVVIIGPSGSGKSTLCRTINRLETIDSGTITIDGRPLPEEGAAYAASSVSPCSAAWRALSSAPFAVMSRSTNSITATGAESP